MLKPELPKISCPPEDFVHQVVATGQKTKKKVRAKWNQSHVIISVEPPTPIPNCKPGTKSHSIRIRYKVGGKEKSKTIHFGKKGFDYVDDHDKNKRIHRFSHLAHQNEVYHPNYWRLHILNMQDTIQDAYIQFMSKMFNRKTK